MEDALVQSGGTAGLIAALWGIATAIKSHRAKQNGGTTYSRIKVLEHKVGELQEEVAGLKEKIQACHRDLCEFREDVRVYFAKAETREEIRREMAK